MRSPKKWRCLNGHLLIFGVWTICTKNVLKIRYRYKKFTEKKRAYPMKVCYNVTGGGKPPM